MFSWRRQTVVTGGDTPAEASPAMGVVERQLSRERNLLSAASSGRPLCRTVPGSPLKHHEGGVVALARLRSRLVADPGQSGVSCAQRLLDEWRIEHEARKGVDWASYTDGGVRALSEALDAITAEEP